jgi:IS30 family transposase
MIDRSHRLPLTRQARVLGISRGSVFYLPKPLSPADLAIMRRIDELHLEFPFAGSRMLRDPLRQEGIEIGRQHVATLMKKMAIEAIYRRPNTSKPAPGHKIYPYLLRKLAIVRPNQVWAPTSATSLWRRGSSTSLPSWTGSAARCSPGECLSAWRPTFASTPWKKRWPAMASQRYSTPTRAARADSTGRRNTSIEEVAMGMKKRRSDRCGRPPLRSPGRPPVATRSERQLFWTFIAGGMSSEIAALKAGLSQPVGTRWFREAGGMPPAMFRPAAKPLSGRYLSLAEREDIALLLVQGHSLQEIGRRLDRSASTISREVRRNATTRGSTLDYRATVAQWHAERSSRRPKVTKLAGNAALRSYVEERLAGVVRTDCGSPVPRPAVSWKGRRHGPRQDRRWAWAWSPEQIARRLAVDFPDDEGMRISHEAIYQALFVQGRGALRRELTACLRTGRTLRRPRARVGLRGKNFVSPDIMISQRPAEADDRAVPGHWEGDLILGLGSSAIGTLVERTTRFTMLLHLPRMEGHGAGPSIKNGPALAGHGAEAVRDAIARTITTLPEELRRSLTWDQGAEMAQHARLKVDAGVQVYFCDPQSPWQRGTNENTNGLLRQYFPKGVQGGDKTSHWSAGFVLSAAE